MNNEKFIKVANRDAYVNSRFIVALEFDRGSEIGEAALEAGLQECLTLMIEKQ